MKKKGRELTARRRDGSTMPILLSVVEQITDGKLELHSAAIEKM